MKNLAKVGRGARVAALAVAAAAACLVLAACSSPSTGGPTTTKYVLTVQGVNCTTSPSGSTAVGSGSNAISALASAGHTMPGSGIWSVVSGSAVIANPDISSTTVTLSADAVIRATAP